MKEYKNHACIGFGCKICIENQEIGESNKREWLNDRLKEIAPCLIDGHEADDDPSFFYLFDGNEYGDQFPIERKDSNHPIAFKLCARCGVVYEEKTK